MTIDPPAPEITAGHASLGGWYGKVSLLLAIVLVMPIWIVHCPPLVDYPNHLARGYILHHYDEVPSFANQFESELLSTPSIAMDACLLAFQPICNVRASGKLFLTLTIWLWLLGWHLLGWAIHGRPTWLALGASLVAYHSMFFYGFTNFSFGLGVFLLSLAAWYRGRTHWPWPRHLLMVVLAVVCYCCHLSAFLFLAGSVLAITIWECGRARKFSLAMLGDVAPVLVPLLFFLRGGGGRGFAWNTLYGKFVGALSLFRGYHQTIDLLFLATAGIFVVLLFVWSTRVRAVGGVLFTGLGCVAMFLLSPHELFGGVPADSRFLLPASALVALSLDLTFPRTKAIVLLGFFLGLVFFRVGMIGYYWRDIDQNVSEQVALIENLPTEARVYPIVNISQDAAEQKRDLPAFHAVCYAVIDRHAYVPSVMGITGHTPIRHRTPPIIHHARADRIVKAADVNWDKVAANYDHIWCHRATDELRAVLTERCVLVVERGPVTVWQISDASKKR